MTRSKARETAEGLLGFVEPRWSHVEGVAAAAKQISESTRLPSTIVDAAWLHDIGYASALALTGFHPLDGAAYLADQGYSDDVVGLVAFHTGAEFEARERSLEHALNQFSRPEQPQLDALILADLSVSPQGVRVGPEDRIGEILARYPWDDPVHRAVTRSKQYLLACARRAAIATGSPDEWGFAAA